MEEDFKKIIEKLNCAFLDKKSFELLISEEKKIKTKIKVEPFDYNMELYFNIILLLEDNLENTAETSVYQIKIGEFLFENDFREKFIQTKEQLWEELTDFQSHSRE